MLTRRSFFQVTQSPSTTVTNVQTIAITEAPTITLSQTVTTTFTQSPSTTVSRRDCSGICLRQLLGKMLEAAKDFEAYLHFTFVKYMRDRARRPGLDLQFLSQEICGNFDLAASVRSRCLSASKSRDRH